MRRSQSVTRPFEEIVTEHGPAVMRVCRALLGATDAEDAWSDTFLSALRAYPRLRPGSNLRGWLITIAHRKAIDVIRRATRTVPTAGPAPEGVAMPPRERDDELRAAVETLPLKQRWAVIYRYLGDLPYAEIATLLECNEAAARRNAADGIAKLRASLNRGDR